MTEEVINQEEDELTRDLKVEQTEQLHVICLNNHTFQVKLAFKQSSLFDPRVPLIVAPDLNLGYALDQPIAKIPLRIFQPNLKLSSQSDFPSKLIPLDHSSITLPSTLLKSISNFLLGFQWIPILSSPHRNLQINQQTASPLLKAVQRHFGLETSQSLLNELPGWELYDNFILFQSNAFQSENFLKLLNDEYKNQEQKKTSSEFFKIVAQHFQVSHVARKGFIDRTDVSRQPKIVPLFGQFRQEGYQFEQPNESFDKVFWTWTKFTTPKGPINYVWAPSETMYSRGNSKEKIRISKLNNVHGKIIVDMCSGIGFFSFGYLLAGASQVIACEISPWAVEGLRRGAIANGFSYEIQDRSSSDVNAQLLIFQGTNQDALPIYKSKASHVNLGLLPSSIEFLPQSIQALRPEGGWLHIHGEIGVGGGPIARQHAAKIWAEDLVKQVISLGRKSASTVNIHWIKSIGPAKEHIVVELEVGSC